jgi:hypothetical protein
MPAVRSASRRDEAPGFFRDPEAMTAKGALDSIDPDLFDHRIACEEVAAWTSPCRSRAADDMTPSVAARGAPATRPLSPAPHA